MHRRPTLLALVAVLSLFVNTTALMLRPSVATTDALPQAKLPHDRVLPGFSTPTPKADKKILSLPIGQVKAATTELNPQSIHVPVLLYHYIRHVYRDSDALGAALSVNPDMFGKQLAYLKANGYTTITPNDLYNALYQGSALPSKPVLLTFDDGYADFASDALPLIRQYDVKVTAFIPSDRIGTPNYMTWDQLKAAAQDPHVTIACHTRHHVNLAQTPASDLENEIIESRHILESKIGRAVDIFAYPYGAFNPQVVEIVRKAGYKLAFSTNSGMYHTQADQLLIKRVTVNGDVTLNGYAGLLM